MRKIERYLRHYGACEGGIKWALENCNTMEEVWRRCPRWDWMIWLAQKCLCAGDLDEFGLWCAEQVAHLMADKRSSNALKVTRSWLDGKADDKDLAAAGAAAWAAQLQWLRDNTKPNFNLKDF